MYFSHDLCVLAIETQFSLIAQYVLFIMPTYPYSFYPSIFFALSFVLCSDTMQYSYCFRCAIHTATQSTRLNHGNCWFKSNNVYKFSVMVCAVGLIWGLSLFSTKFHVTIVLIKLFLCRGHFNRSIFQANCILERIVLSKAISKSTDWINSVW